MQANLLRGWVLLVRGTPRRKSAQARNAITGESFTGESFTGAFLLGTPRRVGARMGLTASRVKMAVKQRFCQRCRVEIPQERVEALPETRLCVACSREVGGEFDITVKPENLSKISSLKKNYGGYTITRKRRKIEPKEDA